MLLAWAVFGPTGLAAEGPDLALQGRWSAESPDTHAMASWGQAFNPQQLHVFADARGSWVALTPAGGQWPSGDHVLEVRSPGLQAVTLHAPGATPRTARLGANAADTWPMHDSLVFPLPGLPPDGQPLLLEIQSAGVIAAPMSFAVEPVAGYLRDDARWLAFAAACLAVMAAMALMALVFAFDLRDATFAFYAVFVLAYALILSIQCGFAYDPLGWDWIAAAPRWWGRLATAVSVVFAILFLDRFAHLRRHAPGGRRLLIGYAAATALLSLAGMLPIAAALVRVLVNPMLILGGPLIVVVALVAAFRGSRYALFYLVGWIPLLAVTVLGSLQLYGLLAGWTGSGDAALAAGAFDAVVLSLGLADRSLALRRDRDAARRLADIDPLTGVWNRRAWSDRLARLEESARRFDRPLSLLFLDLDKFKQLNDIHGHEAGDAALQSLAQWMHRVLRDHEQIGRYGGEEFVVSLPGTDGPRAMQVAERLRRQVQAMGARGGAVTGLTVSIGVATLRPDESTADLIHRADAAMYAAKAAGRNRVVRAEGGMGEDQ
jgi:diguanylate cyclase (GGDEF)-like protein